MSIELTKEEKIQRIAEKFEGILDILDLDLSDESLRQTPYRIAKMYVEDLFSGLDPETFPKVTLFKDNAEQDPQSNMIFMKLKFSSMCEHHFIPMNGTAYVAYVPNGKLFGFSTIPKIIHFFSKRPQLQERLSAQIAEALSTFSESEHVAVSLHAQHQCMIARGAESLDSLVITHVLRGDFNANETLRNDFLNLVNAHKPTNN